MYNYIALSTIFLIAFGGALLFTSPTAWSIYGEYYNEKYNKIHAIAGTVILLTGFVLAKIFIEKGLM